ncbi:MAG: hypothetical protein QJR03_15285 [Sphaerobacter sp.]|nr:hypothetical protein [Sphaerobacter sp.]
MDLNDLMKQAREARAEFQRAADAIRKDRDLTAAAKQRRLKQLHEAHDQQMADLRRQADAAIQAERQRLRRAAFGVDPALTDSYRAAIQIAERAASQDELRRILRRAEDVGDQALAKAVALIAVERSWRAVLSNYLSSRPQAAQAVAALAAFEATVGDAGWRLALKSNFAAAPRPVELSQPAPVAEMRPA